MAGCCYGKPTDSFFGVVFTDPACYANPKGEPLHPTQLYEAGFILVVLLLLVYLRGKRSFYGQLFLVYLIAYAAGRMVLEIFRGDEARGYIWNDYLSHSQFISLIILIVAGYLYFKWSRQNSISYK